MAGIALSVAAMFNLPNRYLGTVAANFLIDTGIAVFLVYAAFRFFKKKRNTPATMIAFMITGIVANAVLMGINAAGDMEPLVVICGKALAEGVVGAAIWIPYFLVSKRVRRTFVVP